LSHRLTLSPLIKNIAFFPYLALGIMTIAFQPFYEILMTILQAREQAKLYSIVSFIRFLVRVSLTIGLVVFLKWRAAGVLLAGASASFIFFIYAGFYLRNDIKICFHTRYLKEALKYSLPLIPHQASTRVKLVTDKLLINRFIDVSSTGLYNIGFQFGNILNIVTTAVNRAIVPIFMDAMKQDNMKELDELKKIGLFLVFFYCICGFFISIFAREIIIIFTTKNFYESFIVIPFLTYNFVVTGVYYLFVNVLFYYKNTTKFVSAVNVTSVALNILLNWLLIIRWGIIGAAVATLATNVFLCVLTGLISGGYTKITWAYIKFAILVLFSFSVATVVNFHQFQSPIYNLLLKTAIFIGHFFILYIIAWGKDFNYLRNFKQVVAILKSD
jgi:O-antigen/teichoic acid export membrane protein